jgi:hypothetical protein
LKFQDFKYKSLFVEKQKVLKSGDSPIPSEHPNVVCLAFPSGERIEGRQVESLGR